MGLNQTGINFTAVAPSNSITLDADVSKDGASAEYFHYQSIVQHVD